VELFEILFILFFILIPVLEGIRKSRQGRGSPDIELPDRPSSRPTRGPEPSARGEGYGELPDRPPPRRPEPEPVEAADMIPDDLWEILTGERREGRRPTPVEDRLEPDEPWMAEPDERWQEEPLWEREAEPVTEERFEPRPWMDSPEAMRDEDVARPAEIVVPEPVDERPARAPRPPRPPRPPRISLREVVEAPKVQRETSPLMRSLQSQQGLRQAVLLKEILGRPKGMEF
jgi:hypothetical protein